MKKKIKYTNGPMGKVRVIKDFLPSPEELAFKEETVKVTISLSKASIEFFKKEVSSLRVPPRSNRSGGRRARHRCFVPPGPPIR
ncbi:MAG: hypothetical protein V3R78_07460, partial [Thermodesulfobacteriota bacterium]